VVSGIGTGAGGRVCCIAIGGVGVGAGSDIRGFQVGGIGVGSGGDVTGITVAGIGVGAGNQIRGITVAGFGVGAPRIWGGTAAPLVGAEEAEGVVIAPILFRTEIGGRLTGVSVSAVNAIRGFQRGVTIGIVNYAERVTGLQFGVVNVIRDNPVPFRVLPIVNAGRSR
jgi:hypothetical protein